jgi:hypothetical protein
MLKKIYRTLFATMFLMSIAMPAIAGSEPIEEKMQQHSEQMETEQVMEHAGKEMKEMAQIQSEVKGTDQEAQETGQEMREKHENPHE